MKRWDVLGFGAVAVDDLVYLDRYPQADEKMPMRGRPATAAASRARHWSPRPSSARPQGG